MGWAFLNYLSPGLFIRNFILVISRLMHLNLDSFLCVHQRDKLSLRLFSLNHNLVIVLCHKASLTFMWQFYFWFIPALTFNCSKLSVSLWLQITSLGRMSDSHPYIYHRQPKGWDDTTSDVTRWDTEIMTLDNCPYFNPQILLINPSFACFCKYLINILTSPSHIKLVKILLPRHLIQ